MPLFNKILYALISYFAIFLGYYYFVYNNENRYSGFIFGFVVYAVFDFTNLVLF